MTLVRLAAVLVVVLGSCGSPSPAPEAAAVSAAMCAEHGVLEALCTQCHPALVAVFRANGNYCEEHGFPESICPVCHPERGGRPPADVEAALAADEPPADGLLVRLATPELAASIGIQVEEVVAAEDFEEFSATAQIAYQTARVARLDARAPGLVRTVHVGVGDHVEADAPLVTLASPLVAADRARVEGARTRVRVAEAAVERREALGDIVATRDRMDSERERDEARSELAALTASAGSVGRGGRGAEYVLRTPIAGVVTEMLASVGTSAAPGDVLVEVVDPSEVWVDIELPEADAGAVRAGTPVRIEVGDPPRAIDTTLDYVAPEINPRTRTVRARASLRNDDGSLLAHAFARALVRTPRGEPAWRVPRDAVQRAHGASLVFVQIAPEVFEVRRIEVLHESSDGASLEIAGRLALGERVVVDGAFLLRTETLRDSIGAGCCEVEETSD